MDGDDRRDDDPNGGGADSHCCGVQFVGPPPSRDCRIPNWLHHSLVGVWRYCLNCHFWDASTAVEPTTGSSDRIRCGSVLASHSLKAAFTSGLSSNLPNRAERLAR